MALLTPSRLIIKCSKVRPEGPKFESEVFRQLYDSPSAIYKVEKNINEVKN